MLRFEDRFPVYDDEEMPHGWLENFLRDEARSVLNENGGLLVRNSAIHGTPELERLARTLIEKPAKAYIGGVVQRSSHSEYVFSSTELTAMFKLKLHNEMAYQENFPRYISFFCAEPPSVLGETPVAHEQDIQKNLPASLRHRIMNDSVVYVRRYLSRDHHVVKVSRLKSMFVPWQEAFSTEDKSVVEQHCRDMNAKFEWDAQDTLTVHTILPASRIHPETDKQVYFNQLLTQNFSVEGLGPAGYFFHRAVGIGRDSAPRDSHLASYGALSGADRSALDSAYSKAARAFKWRKHDWMILDNLQVMHARNRFLGKRAIWVVMGD